VEEEDDANIGGTEVDDVVVVAEELKGGAEVTAGDGASNLEDGTDAVCVLLFAEPNVNVDEPDADPNVKAGFEAVDVSNV